MHTLILALKCYAVAAPLVGLIAWLLVHGGARVEKRDDEIRRIRMMEEV